MRFVVQLCVDALHIMVVHKVVKPETVGIVPSQIIKTLYCVCNFKVVVIVMTGIERFVEMIVCHGMQCALVYPARIIAVNDFSHKPEIGLYFVSNAAQSFHKVEVKHVCRVKPNTVHVKFFYPKTNDIADIIFYGRVSLI